MGVEIYAGVPPLCQSAIILKRLKITDHFQINTARKKKLLHALYPIILLLNLNYVFDNNII
ncbi:hypothetical protein YEP4_07547 [Yersinia enterocolitica subsp. palearctica YE-P4]|uniref:Uncharacterized protein n=2 Tax=Yersinia enterocolitica TaxID=630 RepID=A0A0H3NNC5_YERE1|nr:hypothetical protein XM56_07275 [Yersinia enterocolitica]EHB22290.1 hypothetical protein IOK_02891 [Yersinia enterocolitica subsp. palearctica PhRBD_Ye1]EOR68267.1 hypothetical protein YE149_07629 [Yersinia enterocolitica subsp. palearctica YE-149]EOR77429.1 hypothetical protein YE150_07580 [Yersinia enterocolitica subsp. palearctica YE-150]EOR77615.1 hypothetical protein YEP1_07640 [Yersinia enterocolitica subsp. palearctica YE-P1]EOR82108.1 hypothetical protein YEP4_07547 [Yersinia entero